MRSSGQAVLATVGRHGEAGPMEVLDSDVAAIPAENIHVPISEFAAVWAAAEAAAATAWRAVGVAETCRWLAAATVRPAGQPWHPAPAPVSHRTARRATPELIEQECLEAEVLAARATPPRWLDRRPGWLDGVCMTFAWAWRRKAPPPFEIDGAGTGVATMTPPAEMDG
jgi:hypothetical protein